MEKKLPKVFAGTIDHKIDNNKEVFYSKKNSTIDVEPVKNDQIDHRTVSQKISAIFSSPNYVYKADVHIELKDGSMDKRIVGRNEKYLITMENDKILLDDIKDIWVK